ncbi:SDR family oxidoreductase [Halomicroarcula limicola]|uniref:SDR family oxidoreductase n=1 Tax=Haloarcula limicola TaxID=1429915 RepID=A0A8J7Y4R6_9EURY|nr:SDR family NAD(P)-dependent oxidoreductase [Halomicroarcula limicola]MBV0923992.1 SDR family oxidoreductase [Halomicroarcula limicola]
MEYDFTDRTVLVTGSGRGMGKAAAEKFAENGASVVVNDLDAEVAESTAAEIRATGADAIGVGADVSDEAEVAAMVETAADEFGTVDVLLNNAGVGDAGPFLDEQYDDTFQLNLDVHLHGSLNCIREVVDGMVEQGYGKIVNTTSIHTKNAVGMSPAYDVGKFSLLGLTKSLALELGREGIRVNAVAPGWADTRMTDEFSDAVTEQILDNNPLGRFADPEDVANAMVFLASPAGDYINGHELRVDGGQVPIDSWRLDNR